MTFGLKYKPLFFIKFYWFFFSCLKQGHQPGNDPMNTSNDCNIKSINYQLKHSFIIRLYTLLGSTQWLMFFYSSNTSCQEWAKFLYPVCHSRYEMYLDLVLQNCATSYSFAPLNFHAFYFFPSSIISINILKTCTSSKNNLFIFLLKRYILMLHTLIV